jgi:hypothetical protein
MLDIEIVTQPTQTALNVVSRDEFASHLRLSPSLRNNATWIANMEAALKEAVDDLHGFSGSLNRMVLPCTVKRYLTGFPARGKPILLPYPDLINVVAVTIEDGSSPANNLPTTSYKVSKGTLIGEVWAVNDWPQVTRGPRAVSVTYEAGFAEYPHQLKRLVKIMAAHFMENPEATINEPRQMQINRKVEFGVEALRSAFRIPVSYDDWE